MEEMLRARTAEHLLASGVILHAPDLVRVSPLARVEPGAELSGPCEICGRTEIRRGASVASHCVVRDSLIREGAEIRAFSHLEDARVGEGALVGPFARLRPGAELEADSHVGNFVELKKTRLGKGAKANHLSYLGDARIGAGANIGAGHHHLQLRRQAQVPNQHRGKSLYRQQYRPGGPGQRGRQRLGGRGFGHHQGCARRRNGHSPWAAEEFTAQGIEQSNFEKLICSMR